MVQIKFKPTKKTFEVPSGTNLLDALHSAGIDINSACGGKGSCGKCLIKIQSGTVQTVKSNMIAKDKYLTGYVLSCQSTTLKESIVIESTAEIDKGKGQFIDHTTDTSILYKEFIEDKGEIEPLIQKYEVVVPQPQLEDGLSDLDRLSNSIQQTLMKRLAVDYTLPVMSRTAETLRQSEGRVAVFIQKEAEYCRVVQIEPSVHCHKNYGIAIDVGTTTISVQLVDLLSSKRLGTITDYNEQVVCGLDVISRINYAQKPSRLKELQKRVLQTINRLLINICRRFSIESQWIYNAVIAGNTTMIHLLLGLNPEYIRLEPYTPTLLAATTFSGADMGIKINPSSALYISPGVGSYIGGDISAGLLCTDIVSNSKEICMFIDIGTNGEIVIGNNDFLIACACSAGPAFEGGGIKDGKRAMNGAIDKVDIDSATGIATYNTIGDVGPDGICGSGMISLLANLFLTGWLDAAGKLNRDKSSPCIKIEGRKAAYILVSEQESTSGKAIQIDETDIENILRAKAAIYSASALLLSQIGLKFANLTKIYIAGGFGRFLNIDKAIAIGMIPDLPRDKYQYIGNSSLTGASKALVSSQSRKRMVELARRITSIELSTNPDYMTQYTAAMFIPHTHSQQFPSVKKPFSKK